MEIKMRVGRPTYDSLMPAGDNRPRPTTDEKLRAVDTQALATGGWRPKAGQEDGNRGGRTAAGKRRRTAVDGGGRTMATGG